MRFDWTYHGEYPKKLRNVLKQFGASTALIKVAIFHGGEMRINNEPQWARALVQPEDEVSLIVPDEAPNPVVTASDAPLDIVYEDDDFLVVNKPAGVATVPAHNVAVHDSLVNRLKGYYQRQNYPNQVTHVATRLDRDTSGLVVFPKHRFAHAVLDQQLKQHQVTKRYLAIATGKIESKHGVMMGPIARDPASFVKRQVIAGGKASITEYWLQQVSPSWSVVEVLLHTGRTHQIRVHFAALGHPLLGDDMYGHADNRLSRQALHCGYVQFYSPFKEQVITLTAPLPADLQTILAN